MMQLGYELVKIGAHGQNIDSTAMKQDLVVSELYSEFEDPWFYSWLRKKSLGKT